MLQRLDTHSLPLLYLLSISFLAAAPPAHTQGDRRASIVTRSAQIMGTTFVIQAVHGPEVADALEAALAEARRLDHLLSNYRPDSEWSHVNAHAADGPVKLSPELFQLLAECLKDSKESEGTFDVTVGALMRTWGFYKDSGHLANQTAIEDALRRVGWQHVHLNAQERTVFFDQHGLEIDPGGVGKGYAVDRMVDVLRARHVTGALVSAGGSSMYGLGHPIDDARGWRVMIRDPKNENGIAAVVVLRDQSLSTSGSYERFFWAKGRVYSHIMDPRTGTPASGMLSVSILSPRTIDSEIWAKPYYILGREWTASHLPPGFKVLMCEDLSDSPCEWVQPKRPLRYHGISPTSQ